MNYCFLDQRGTKDENFDEYSFGNLCFAVVLCRCKIGAGNPCNCQLSNYCRRFGGAYSFLSFLEVNYVECFVFHLGSADGRLRRSPDYRAHRSPGASD